MSVLKAPEKIVPYVTGGKITFVIIGCGGTGSYLIRDLARLIGITNEKYHINNNLFLIDGDVVEQKNLNRQNFIEADLGKNKAEVLAERYGSSFGVEIPYISEFYRESTTTTILDALRGRTIILVGCVDNNKTRHMINRFYRTGNSQVRGYIDVGNEEFAGQAVISLTNGYSVTGQSISFRYGEIKSAVEKFEMDNNDKHPDEESCAEHAISAPQNIATNILAANVVFNYCNAIVTSSATLDVAANGAHDHASELQYCLKFKEVMSIAAHVCFFNSKAGTISTEVWAEDVSSKIERSRIEGQRVVDRLQRSVQPYTF